MRNFAFRIRDTSGWTIFIFGSMALLFGLIGLLKPEAIFAVLGVASIDRAQRAAGDLTLPFLAASSMASFNMGAYYILAALNDQKAFYSWTVPFRGVTFTVFTILVLTGLAPIGWIGIAIWELCGGIATGLALHFEKQRPASVA
jgi:hypothetical protein